MLGVSTCWRSRSAEDGAAIVRDIARLGARAVEIDFRLSRESLDQVVKTLGETGIIPLSIHAVVPAPENKPEGRWAEKHLLCSTDETQRTLAVKDVAGTLRLASDMNVGAVVLHIGEAPMEKVTLKLQRMYDMGKIKTMEGKRLANNFKIERLKSRGATFENLLRSLDELNNIASKLNVYIGVENRYYMREYPNFEELAIIFYRLAGSNIKYWHDTGHAQAQQNLGIIDGEAYLEEFSEQLIGFHLHDVDGYQDHLAPPADGRDGVDFSMVKKYFKPGDIAILEMRDGVSEEKAARAFAWLESQGFG